MLPKIEPWTLSVCVLFDLWSLGEAESVDTCLTCDRRTAGYHCMLWDQEVSYDYSCSSWRKRIW